MRTYIRFVNSLAIALVLGLAQIACAQLPLDPLSKPTQDANPLTNPGLSPGTAFLFQMESRFEQETLQGCGAAFASWFAEDGVTLANGKAPVIGRAAIASSANWRPENYHLSWTPTGGQLSADGQMGYTWGTYQGVSKDAHGKPVITAGRYMTIWKKQSDGTWKVALDASNDGPPAAGDCCRIP